MERQTGTVSFDNEHVVFPFDNGLNLARESKLLLWPGNFQELWEQYQLIYQKKKTLRLEDPWSYNSG